MPKRKKARPTRSCFSDDDEIREILRRRIWVPVAFALTASRPKPRPEEGSKPPHARAAYGALGKFQRKCNFPSVPGFHIGTTLTKEECVAPPVLAFYTLGTQRLRAGLTCDAPTALGEGGACRRRGRRGRGGGRRVRRRSGGARGRGGGENRRRRFLLSGCCIPCNWRPGCGRNCVPSALAARRGPGTGPTAGCGASSRNIARARARGWSCATACSE